MGGNALSVKSVRLASGDYFDLVNKVMRKLEHISMRKAVIPAYRQKPDFGDMDILFASNGDYNPIKIASKLKATEGVSNGDVTSIGVSILPSVSSREGNTFQIDLIKVSPDSFDFALRYFAFNDMGNLLGRVAHKAGFKLGHMGLLYPMRDPDNSDHVLGELVVTRDWGKALEFFGYDAEAYEKSFPYSFDTITDIFKFVVSSKFVNKDIYLLDNRNAKARVRDSKRKTYMQFLEWLENNHLDFAYDWSDKRYQHHYFLCRAFVSFPEFEKAYEDLVAETKHKKAVNAKFNGKMVMELTGLSGAFLGDFMAYLRELSNLDTFMLSSSDADIEDFIKFHFDVFTLI